MVLEDLSDLYDDTPDRRRGTMTRKKINMALASLEDLSRRNKVKACNAFNSGEMAKHIQDLPQASRCKTDVDASRDFARAQGYLAMLRVIKSSPPNSEYVKIAASILAGFASSLSVLAWQPSPGRIGEGFDSQHRILRDGTARTDMTQGQECGEVQVSHCIPGGDEAAEGRGAQQQIYYKMQLSNSFTTLCPLGWSLETEIPDFHGADTVWAQAVNSALRRLETVDILLDAAIRSPNLSSSIVTDCVRTLSSLWSRRMIKWHRFDDELLNDFPQPMALIGDLGRADDVRAKLKLLVNRFSEFTSDSMITAPFCNLHLAKILISQGIRDVDAQVAQILLQCLCYWRQALSSRELDWFACETIETLRDLFATSTQQIALKQQIWESVGGVSCLTLMLNAEVSVSRSVRFFEEDHQFMDHMVRVPHRREKPWADDAGTHANHCAAAAARLFAELIKSNEVFDMLSQPRANEAFFVTLFNSLHSNLELQVELQPEQREGVLVRPGTHGLRTSPAERNTILSSFLNQFTGMGNFHILLFEILESIGNPAWRPGFDLFKDAIFAPAIAGKSPKHQLEHFERAVNNLLARVYAARITSYVIHPCAHESHQNDHSFVCHHLLRILLPSLVKHFVLRGPFPTLPTCLGLDEWQNRLHEEADSLIAKVLVKVVLCHASVPTSSPVATALEDLYRWATDVHGEDRQESRDITRLVELVHGLNPGERFVRQRPRLR
ncbi:hypothetical protein CBR_g50200 [Chara braunii]|uniref:Uncharacterized protein n=1 Tax=Chara braunii TaxID=69332 RepID=A0A388M692_CHABU|nr:hypothetical protein CBR_g50200 [Chara braunii]|eukprot:GBG90108.1 hypothetical protein CBR_g50200 [Chara braunii]